MSGVIRSVGLRSETCPDILEQNPDDSFSQMVEKYWMNGNNTEGKSPAEPEERAAKTAEIMLCGGHPGLKMAECRTLPDFRDEPRTDRRSEPP